MVREAVEARRLINRGELHGRKAIYCPYCMGDLQRAGADNWHCARCRAVVRIVVEMRGIAQPPVASVVERE